MSKHLGVSALAVVCTVMSACGTGNFANKEDLNGTTWSSDCGMSGTFKTEVKFTEVEMTFSLVSYDATTANVKTNCQTEDSRVTYVYDYTLGDEVADSMGGLQAPMKLDLSLKRIDVLAVTDDGLTELTKIGGDCTGVTFTKGTAKDVLADAAASRTSCGGIVTKTFIAGDYFDTLTGLSKKIEAGTKVYQLTAIENQADDAKVMFFGNSTSTGSDGFTEARRPASLALTPLKKR